MNDRLPIHVLVHFRRRKPNPAVKLLSELSPGPALQTTEHLKTLNISVDRVHLASRSRRDQFGLMLHVISPFSWRTPCCSGVSVSPRHVKLSGLSDQGDAALHAFVPPPQLFAWPSLFNERSEAAAFSPKVARLAGVVVDPTPCLKAKKTRVVYNVSHSEPKVGNKKFVTQRKSDDSL